MKISMLKMTEYLTGASNQDDDVDGEGTLYYDVDGEGTLYCYKKGNCMLVGMLEGQSRDTRGE
jgi:hypothetical protein